MCWLQRISETVNTEGESGNVFFAVCVWDKLGLLACQKTVEAGKYKNRSIGLENKVPL